MSAGKQIAKVPRTVPMPVEYVEACKALAACVTIDEAKRWADKAEALAAWAKIYRSDEASVQAARLKLHAYRRMGKLAEEIRPLRHIGGQGYALGPPSL